MTRTEMGSAMEPATMMDNLWYAEMLLTIDDRYIAVKGMPAAMKIRIDQLALAFWYQGLSAHCAAHKIADLVSIRGSWFGG